MGISYSDSTPSVSFSYTVDGLKYRMVDGGGTTTYSYDNLHDLQQQQKLRSAKRKSKASRGHAAPTRWSCAALG